MSDGKDKKNVPAVFKPAHTLTEHQTNIIRFEVKGYIKQSVYCENAFIVDGWLTMNTLRVQDSIVTSIKPIRKLSWYNSNRNDSSNLNSRLLGSMDSKNSYSEDCYVEQESKVVRAESLHVINSFNENQLDQIPLWARTTKEEALTQINEKVTKINDGHRKHNGESFSKFVDDEVHYRKHRLVQKEWYKKSWITKKFSGDREKWIDNKLHGLNQKEKDKILQEVINEIKQIYQSLEVEYTGKLEYKPEV